MNQSDFTIGVLDYRFALPKPCQLNRDDKTIISLSFELAGDFLRGAISDELVDTIDYEKLCEEVELALADASCANQPFIINIIKKTINGFAPNIAAGRFMVKIMCHETSIIEEALL